MQSRFIATALIVGTLIFGMAEPGKSQTRRMDTTRIQGHLMYTLGDPGMIPSIFAPDFIDVDTADTLYHPAEPLLVALGQTEVKGYSTWHLDAHEVVNDSLDGIPIAATW